MPSLLVEQRNRRLWLETVLIFAAWTVFGLLLANQNYMQSQLRGQAVPWLRLLRSGLLDAYLWAFSTLVIFWLARRFPFERGRVLRRVAAHLLAAVVLSVARAGFMAELSQRVDWLGARPFVRLFWASYSQNFLFYGLLLGIGHVPLYYGRYRERERAAEQLARGLTEARLQALKMQLQRTSSSTR